MIGLFFFGFGVGVWDVAQNLEGTVIEQAQGKAIMPWFHAAFSAGTVLGALVGAIATNSHFPIGIHVPLAAGVTGVLLWFGTARYLPMQKPIVESAGQGFESKQKSSWAEPRTLLIGLMVLAAAFTEGTANDWTAVAFVDGHGTSTTVGVFGLATFLTFMTAGRIFGTKALDRFGRVTTLRVLFVSAVMGCLLVVFGGTTGAFVGAAIWGVGASLGFPVGMSAASDDPRLAARRISVVATMGYVAFLAGPPLIGFLGEWVGILRALLAVALVGALAFLAVPAAKPLTK
jgi:fucose permease